MLQRLRQSKYMARLAHFSGHSRRHSGARFFTDLAAVTSLLTTNVCDVLFVVYSRASLDAVLRRHGATLEAFEIIHDVVARPSILEVLGYSVEQVGDTVRQLGMFAGSEGLRSCPPDDEGFRRAADRRLAFLDEAPFMVPLLFLLVSRQLSVLAVAECLSRFRFGFWSEDRRTFFPELSQAAAFGVQRFGGGSRLRRCEIWGWLSCRLRELRSTPSVLPRRGPRAGSGLAAISWTAGFRYPWQRVALLFSNHGGLGRAGVGEACLVSIFR